MAAHILLGVVLVSAGALWLRGLHDTEPPVPDTLARRPASAMRSRGMVLLVGGSAALGVVFASAEVTIVAFCSEQGQRSLSGAVLACLAVGSGLAGFVYGSRTRPAPVLLRYRRQALILGCLPILLWLAPNVPVLAAFAFVVGLGVAPTLITAAELVERSVERPALTEGLAWLITGLNLGYGAGSAIVGQIADTQGARSGFLVAVAAGLLVAGGAVALHARLGTSIMPLAG